MLEVKSINVFYGGFQALFDVHLNVSEKESVITVGPNGAGKTTLLETISGLQHPKSGSIVFRGEHIEKSSAHRIVDMGLSLVPEGARIFPQLTVLENLRIGSFVKRSRNGRDKNLKEIYDLFPRLEERKNQLGDTLSGGERQMLAVARSLMSEPKMIMLDEPSSGLAPMIVSMLLKFINQIRQRGYSILMVEQNVRKALQLCDRAYLLESGSVKMEGDRETFSREEYIRQAYIGI